MTLFELRKSLEMHQHRSIPAAQIAQKAGIRRQQYRRYELGQSVPNVLEAARIAAVFNIKLADLVGIIRATLGQEEEEGLRSAI